MDFSNEYYVRMYVRDTTTWKRLGWNGQAVFMQVLRKMDLSGVLDIEDMEPWEAVALHCSAPADVAQDGVAVCLRLGCLVHNGSQLVAPRYREANESRKSDAQRQREHRAGKALSQSVTPLRDEPSQNVTECRNSVTPSHTESHAVTPSSSLPRSFPSDADASSARDGGGQPAERDPQERELDALSAVLWPGLHPMADVPAKDRERLRQALGKLRKLASDQASTQAAVLAAARVRFDADCAARGKRLGLAVLLAQVDTWGKADAGASPRYRELPPAPEAE